MSNEHTIMDIYPSVLETIPSVFYSQMEKLQPYFNFFQIDIADGKFAPNHTIQIEDVEHLAKNPRLNKKKYEFHLMVNDYQTEISKLTDMQGELQIERVLIHLQPLKEAAWVLPPAPFEYGIVLNPEDSVENDYVSIRSYPYIQIMTVNPGFQGGAFLEKELKKIKILRELGYDGKILLDGGINEKTLPLIMKESPPDIICPGSYLKNDTEHHLKLLQKKLTE